MIFYLPYLLGTIGYAKVFMIVKRHVRFMKQNDDVSASTDGILRIIACILGSSLFGFGPFVTVMPVSFYLSFESQKVILAYVFPVFRLMLHASMELNPLTYGLASPHFKKAITMLFRRSRLIYSTGRPSQQTRPEQPNRTQSANYCTFSLRSERFSTFKQLYNIFSKHAFL